MKDEEEQKAVDTAQKAVKKGWAIGPFDTPPFPNSFCSKQAIVTKSFTIPKHRWIKDGTLRLIFHKSFPLGLSINSLTPRHDAATYFPEKKFHYTTLSKILSTIRAGRGCKITQFDLKDAYKQLLVRTEDLYQQVFRAGGKYFVDFCACFGSLYGNDAYSTFAYAHCVCLSLAADCPLLLHYVDNYTNITPASGTSKFTDIRALIEATSLKRELVRSGALFHQFEGPVTKTICLGWEIDTESMTCSISPERRNFMLTFLESWESKISYSAKDLASLIGLLIFLSQIVGGIKATVGLLIIKRTDMTRSNSLFSIMSERIRWAVSHILFVLKRWQGVAKIFNRAWFNDEADISIYCDIALEEEPAQPGSFGKGAFVLPEKKFFSIPWTEPELKESMRETKHSSAHLELLNMLEAVLFFSQNTQKVLCTCDSNAAVKIATARYSAAANSEMENRLNNFDLQCCECNLTVKFRWAPRTSEALVIADSLSRGEVSDPLVGRPPPFFFYCLFAHLSLAPLLSLIVCFSVTILR